MKYSCFGCNHAPYNMQNKLCTGCGKYMMAPDGEGTVFVYTNWAPKEKKIEVVENPFESLHNTIVFDCKDWSKDKRDAWIYGIIVGWTSDDAEEMEGMFQEFNKKFNWDRVTWNRLQSLHKEYLKYKEMSEK